MKVLLYMDVETPNLHLKQDADDDDIEAVEDEKQNIIEGLTSVDMQNSVAECLGAYYLSLRIEDVDVSMQDAIEVLQPRDRRKLRRFTMGTNGSIRQEDADV